MTVSRRRLVERYGQDLQKNLITQHVTGTNRVEHIRHLHQEMDPVIEHVRETAQKVAAAPTVGNPDGWAYLGSIPMTILLDYLAKRNVRMDQYARNEDGIKDEFKTWILNNRDLCKFTARHHVA